MPAAREMTGRERAAVLVGESKWSRSVNGRSLESALVRKAAALPDRREPLLIALAAREHVRGASADTLAVVEVDASPPGSEVDNRLL